MAESWKLGFLWVRVTLWWLLWFFANLLGFLRRKARGKGWQLHWAIRAVLTLQALGTSFLLAAARKHHQERDLNPDPGLEPAREVSKELATDLTYRTHLFFIISAESTFLFLLFLVATGICITRNTMKPHTAKIVGIPFVNWLTHMICTYIILASKSYDFFTGHVDEAAIIRGKALFISLAIHMITFTVSCLFIVDSLFLEIKTLEGTQDEEQDPAGQQEEAAPNGYTQTATRPANEEAPGGLLGAGQNASHLDSTQDPDSAAAVGEEEQFTVFDAVQTDIKLSLLRQFRTGLFVYALAAVMVKLVPTVTTAVAIDVSDTLYELVFFGFLAALSWIFRPMNDNPYLFVGAELGDDDEMPTTELGVLDQDDNLQGHPTSATSRPTAGAANKMEIDGNFTLEDDEEVANVITIRREGSPTKRHTRISGPKAA